MALSNTVLIEEKSKIKLSHIAWITMFLSILIWGSGGGHTSALGNTGNWYRIILVLFSGAAVIWAIARNASRLTTNVSLSVWLLLLYGMIAFSSSQLIPEHSFYIMWKAIEVLLDVLIVMSIMSERQSLTSIWKAYQILILLTGMLMVSAWIGAVMMPSEALVWSRGYIPFTIQGVKPVLNGNGLAFTAAFIAYTQICSSYRKRSFSIVRTVLILAALITLIVAQSRTSFIGFFVAIAIFLWSAGYKKTFLWLFISSALIFLFTGLTHIIAKYLLRSQSTELVMSLSGRTQGWEAAWNLFLDNPILGSGFAAAARTQVLGVEGASTLHGAVFDVLVGVGTLGFIPWFLAIMMGGWTLYKLSRSKHPWLRSGKGKYYQAEMLGLFALLIVRNLTSSGISMHEHGFMLLLIILAYAGAMTRVTRTKRI